MLIDINTKATFVDNYFPVALNNEHARVTTYFGKIPKVKFKKKVRTFLTKSEKKIVSLIAYLLIMAMPVVEFSRQDGQDKMKNNKQTIT